MWTSIAQYTAVQLLLSLVKRTVLATLVNIGYGPLHWIGLNLWAEACSGDRTVEFVVPSGGRQSLTRALESLKLQTETNWGATIVIDGMEGCRGGVVSVVARNLVLHKICRDSSLSDKLAIHEFFRDLRYKFFCISERIGKSNWAGNIRNIAISQTNSTWVAFLDDDDALHRDYLKHLLAAIESYPYISAIVFRMLGEKRRTLQIIPPHGMRVLRPHWFGISFAMHSSLCKEKRLCFQPSGREDYHLLANIIQNGFTVLLSKHTLYCIKNACTRWIEIKDTGYLEEDCAFNASKICTALSVRT